MTELITIEELEKEIKAKEGEIKEIEIDIGGIDVIRDKTIVVNTLQVAEIFKKQHKNVISKVKEIIKEYPELLNELTFKPIEYIDKRNRKQLMYEMGREGFAILANKFTGKVALGFTIKYVKAFGKMVDLLQEISLLNSKKETLLIEEEKNELKNDLQQYVGMYGNKLIPREFSEYYPIYKHGYSNNYMYKPYIDRNNNIKMAKTQGYKNWLESMREQLKDLPKYVEQHNIDLSKELYICIVASLVPSIDTENICKSLQDIVCTVLGIDDNIVTSLHVYKIKEVDKFEDGRLLLYLRNDHLDNRMGIIDN